ncbi:MAG: alanine--tRNA ligase [Anaerolineae bacterium]|nr:alanine--tRNA ligase [Anaerolineae bacterium]NUQ02398.1 alanine--tRNA ligase [Anaerolineae bacterium]
MKPMTSAEARQAFLDFFAEMGHNVVSSSSLVPSNDPTLLFTNAGMVQFKDVFLGLDKRDYRRATTSQKCMRVAGKHSDLENVGPSPRHHTFFEMLGNFSFGDYFKRDAIRYAYAVLTEVYKLPKDRLAFTVYRDDDEAYDIWVNDIGVDPKRVARMGPKTNFWQMAETGPCGPTSEIHWDKTPDLGVDSIIALMQAEDDRFLELWNLVFMQFNRTQPDPTHTGVHDSPLPAPGVDTGMGLERILSVVNGVTSNYETDLFLPIFAATQQLTGHTNEQRNANIVPYRVIADHIRAAVFLIADGVLPGAKGRDSVCRLVIRRAARFGEKLGFQEPFLAHVADAVIAVMGGHYADLHDKASRIKQVITQEEERFRRTMDRGITELEAELDRLPAGGELSGEIAFYLKATLGLPIQVTKDIVEERGFSVDVSGFQTAEQEHALVSGGGKAMGEIDLGESYNALLADLKTSGALPGSGVAYEPYDPTPFDTTILALLQNGRTVDSVMAGEKVEVILPQTNFYVEAGGQVSDTGVLSGEGWRIEIEDMRRPVGGLVVHIGEVIEGSPRAGAAAHVEVDASRRGDITRNHTGTHLLHAALRRHLGTHVQQRGSLVAPDRLRFDFAHDSKVTSDQLRSIEAEINAYILRNYPVLTNEKSLSEAKAEGAMALFGEKYGERVRTVTISGSGERYSYELCGGCHVKSTSEIGSFVFVNEGSVSAGIRRVEALTGHAAVNYVQQQVGTLNQISAQLSAQPEQISARLSALQDELSGARKQIAALQRELTRQHFQALLGSIETINGKQVLIAQISDVPLDMLREMSDWFRGAVRSGVMVLGSIIDGKPQLFVTVTDDLTKQGVHAGNLVKQIAAVVEGGGGGRPNMAQAGGRNAGKLPDALALARQLL